MSMEHIRATYGVPAKRGMQIIYTGDKEPRRGVISGTKNDYLRVMFDGEAHSDLLHPTWEIEYLTAEPVLPKMPAGTPRGEYGRTLRKDESRVAYMVRLGLGLVMMQEQELDRNGKREQSAQDPQWFRVDRFLAREDANLSDV